MRFSGYVTKDKVKFMKPGEIREESDLDDGVFVHIIPYNEDVFSPFDLWRCEALDAPAWYRKKENEYEEELLQKVEKWHRKHVFIGKNLEKIVEGTCYLKNCTVEIIRKDAFATLVDTKVDTVGDDATIVEMCGNSEIETIGYGNPTVLLMRDDSKIINFGEGTINVMAGRSMVNKASALDKHPPIIKIMTEGACVKKLSKKACVELMSGNSMIKMTDSDCTIKCMSEESKIRKLSFDSTVESMIDSAHIQMAEDRSFIKRMLNSSSVTLAKDYTNIEIMINNSKVNLLLGDASVNFTDHNAPKKISTKQIRIAEILSGAMLAALLIVAVMVIFSGKVSIVFRMIATIIILAGLYKMSMGIKKDDPYIKGDGCELLLLGVIILIGMTLLGAFLEHKYDSKFTILPQEDMCGILDPAKSDIDYDALGVITIADMPVSYDSDLIHAEFSEDCEAAYFFDKKSTDNTSDSSITANFYQKDSEKEIEEKGQIFRKPDAKGRDIKNRHEDYADYYVTTSDSEENLDIIIRPKHPGTGYYIRYKKNCSEDMYNTLIRGVKQVVPEYIEPIFEEIVAD